MNTRTEARSKMESLFQEMQETEEAFLRYIKARDEANTEFCLFSNRFGFREAVRLRGEALRKIGWRISK
ncbi:hypothetical protein [Streptomyces sp. WG5]|uniref:hypothetical protein n=1 Tax=Streptomyces sp. WG5 TaxID=3417648 RepID=UPI003CE8F3B6